MDPRSSSTGFPWQDADLRRLGENTRFVRQLPVKAKRDVTLRPTRENAASAPKYVTQVDAITRQTFGEPMRKDVYPRTHDPCVRVPYCSRLSPPDHDQGISAVRAPAPLEHCRRPGRTGGRHEQHPAMIEPADFAQRRTRPEPEHAPAPKFDSIQKPQPCPRSPRRDAALWRSFSEVAVSMTRTSISSP